MTRPVHRRTTPGVRNGRVRPKNRPVDRLLDLPSSGSRLVIDRRRPGPGYRHVLTVQEIRRFLDLLPESERLLGGLRAIVLDEGHEDCLGWCDRDAVAVCAWDRNLERNWRREFVEEHRTILARLGVTPAEVPGPFFRCRFTEASARGFLLMHVLLHELGHHRDRMTTRSRRHFARGEDFAEDYANRLAETLWDRYFAEFGW